MPDTEEVAAVIVKLREEHPHGPLTGVLRLVDWDGLRRQGEGYWDYMDRMHGPMEPL